MLGKGSFGKVYSVVINGKIYALKICEVEESDQIMLIDSEIETN